MMNFSEERRKLVKRLIREGYIRSEKTARAMMTVPRELFVPQPYAKYAYEDTPLPTLCGQTISAPHMCALMCEELDLKEGELVLEIGTGSGYHAALCAEIVAPKGSKKPGHVYSIEIIWELACYAHKNLRKAGYSDRVTVTNADGTFTIPFRTTFDKILVTAAAPRLPSNLLKWLKDGGLMIVPVGSSFYQELLIVKKLSSEKYVVESRGGCIFVRIQGKGVERI